MFEYAVVRFGAFEPDAADEVVKTANARAQDGWRLVSVCAVKPTSTYSYVLPQEGQGSTEKVPTIAAFFERKK